MMGILLPFPAPEPSRPMQSRWPTAKHEAPEVKAPDDGVLWGRLMALAQGGDRVAYHALLQGVAGYLAAITRRYLGDGPDAEDAVQDILIVVDEIRHTYEPERPFKPWLSTIASRRCIDLLRRRSRRLHREIASDDDLSNHAASDDTPEEALAREQTGYDLRNTLDALPARQRDAIRLVHLDELSLGEAAARSKQSVGAIKVACHRALKSLQRKLRRQDKDHE